MQFVSTLGDSDAATARLGGAARLLSPASAGWGSVWLGVAASAMVALGSTNDEFAFAPSGWPNAGVKAVAALAPVPFDKVLLGLGAVLLTLAWWRLRPHRGLTAPPAAAVLALWSLPLLLAPPVLSMDPALYADLGWIQLQGLNPYDVGLTGAGGPFAGQVDSLWAGKGVAYPPLALVVDRLVVAAAGAHPWWSIVAMRVPVLLSLAVMAVTLPRIAVRLGRPPRAALWLGLLNPLVVIHVVGGAHNDAPMVAMTLVAILLVLRFPTDAVSLVAAPAVLGLAMAFKQQGGLAVVAAAGLPVAASLAALPRASRLWLLGRRTLVAAVVACLAFVAVTLATGLGFGWSRWLELMGRAPTPAPLGLVTSAGSAVLEAVGADPGGFVAAMGVLSLVLIAAGLGWVLVRFADRPLAAVAWGALVVVLGGQALHPWYLVWPLALFALVPLTRRQRRWVFGLSLFFLNWNAVQTAVIHR